MEGPLTESATSWTTAKLRKANLDELKLGGFPDAGVGICKFVICFLNPVRRAPWYHRGISRAAEDTEELSQEYHPGIGTKPWQSCVAMAGDASPRCAIATTFLAASLPRRPHLRASVPRLRVHWIPGIAAVLVPIRKKFDEI